MNMPKILIVEDDSFLRELYVDLLKKEGYDVTEAADGEDGLAKIKLGGWDLVLLDILLPKIDGFTILNKIENDPMAKTNKKLVLLTNIDRPEELSKAESLSNGYIIKSTCTPEQFLEKVKTYLEK